MILDAEFLARLEPLSLVARHIRAGQIAGERRSTKRGTSIEFADYRDYVRGDDLRRVDWNIYARLERPFVKLFEEEEDLAVHLLLDGSASMDWGEGNENKWLYGRRLAAALGYIGLGGGDQVSVSVLVSPLRSAADRPAFGPARGHGHALRLLQWLQRLTTGGTTDLNGSLRACASSGGRPGLAITISDLFSPAGYLEGLTALAARGYEVVLMHVLCSDEIEPPLGGDLQLVDVETGEPEDVTVDAAMRRLYRRRLAGWRAEIRAQCRARDAHYVPVETSTPIQEVVLTDLRARGIVQ